MKIIYIFLNIVFITIIILTSRSLSTAESKESSLVVKKVKRSRKTILRRPPKRVKTPLNANVAVKYNLFDPNRGSSENKTGKKKSSPNDSYIAQKLKLVGVYRFGKQHGAVIISSSNSRRPRSTSRSRSRRSTRTKRYTPPSQNIQQKTKRFYRLGDTLDNGYVLKKVETRTVLLTKGNDSVTLEIEHNNPTIRETSKPKANAKKISMKVSRPTNSLSRLNNNPAIIN